MIIIGHMGGTIYVDATPVTYEDAGFLLDVTMEEVVGGQWSGIAVTVAEARMTLIIKAMQACAAWRRAAGHTDPRTADRRT